MVPSAREPFVCFPCLPRFFANAPATPYRTRGSFCLVPWKN
uniref:Uncharacterized protein n=1 Tax=Arundo donax TaxID=35708 RepID=A0A0A9T8A1_ARUDO